MTRPSALAYLAGLKESRIRPGLERIRRALVLLGSPHLNFPHHIVGGTNGKGSVIALAGSVLEAAGFSVGRYTSPHLHSFEERIVVDGAAVGSSDLEDLVDVVRACGVELSYFEFATAMAAVHFSRHRVDIALLEAGLGGRWDATNATDPLVSVITSVDMDHTEWLGEDIRGIALEKAMISRPNRPLVVGETGPDALEAILSAARSVNSIPIVSGREFSSGWGPSGEGMWFKGTKWEMSGLRPGLPGLFQVRNAATALAALERLDGGGFPMDLPAVARGIAAARWPGRFHDLGGSPRVLVDAAHNTAAVRCLVQSLGGEREVVWLFSALSDKDIEGMGEVMLSAGERFVLVPLDNPRACPLEEMKRRMPPRAGVTAAADVPEALRLARSLAGSGGTVVAAGSIYLAAEVLREAGRGEAFPGSGG